MKWHLWDFRAVQRAHTGGLRPACVLYVAGKKLGVFAGVEEPPGSRTRKSYRSLTLTGLVEWHFRMEGSLNMTWSSAKLKLLVSRGRILNGDFIGILCIMNSSAPPSALQSQVLGSCSPSALPFITGIF